MVETNFKQTEIGLIPEDWEFKRIGDAFTFKNGLNKEKAFFGYGYPIVNYMDVYNNPGIHPERIKGKVFLNSTELKSFNVKQGDVLFTRTSETQEEIGIASVVLDEMENLVFSGFLLRGRTYTTDFNINFCQYCFRSSEVRQQIISKSSYTTRALTNGRLLSDIFVALPNLDEQQAISKALSDTDAWIGSLEKLIAKKRLIKQGAMQQLLTPKEDWEVASLSDLTKVFTKQTGFDYTAYIKPVLVQTKFDYVIPFIQNKDFNNKWINLNTDYYIPIQIAKKFPRILLDEKSLLISISGAIGNIGVYDNEQLAFIGGAVAILKFKDVKSIDWVMYYLKSDQGQNKLFGNVKAGSHQNLILDDLRKIQIPFPIVDEQIRIANILSDMDKEIDAIEHKLQKAQQIKQGMMQQLLSGKIRLVAANKSANYNEQVTVS